MTDPEQTATPEKSPRDNITSDIPTVKEPWLEEPTPPKKEDYSNPENFEFALNEYKEKMARYQARLQFKKACDETREEELENQPSVLEHINNIENPSLVGKPVIIEAVISSTSIAYIGVPSRIKAFIKGETEDDNYEVFKVIDVDNPVNIGLVDVSKETQAIRLKSLFYPLHAIIEEIQQYRTMYRLRVRPPVFTLEKCGDKIVDEKGYEYKALDIYVASDVPLTFQPSTLMRIVGLPLPNPKTQKTTLLAYKVEFPEDILSFDVSKLAALKEVFKGKSVSDRLNWILDNFELYSHIVGRENIATAGFLTYFTPLYVKLDGEVKEGWGKCGIIGDTTTAKSETVKKQAKLLKAGSIISAETASTVGLTGTATQVEKEGWFIDWGFLPLMDRKLLAIDGSQKLNASCWAALAEAERSGVLSIAKAAKNTTYARTRQLRIYNAVDPEDDKYSTKSLSSFLHPAQAWSTVLDKTSIARLDVAVFSDQRDVAPEKLNVKVTEEYDPKLDYMAEVLKWCWSNTAKVQWEEAAVTLLLDMSTELYNTFFSEEIPLVSIDVKWKIARLSVGLAYSTLSTNDDNTIVTVTTEHVETVVNFLTEEYMKAGLGILAQENKFEKLTLEDIKEIFAIIFSKTQGKIEIEKLGKILHWIVTQNRVTKEVLASKFQLTDTNEMRPLMAVLQSEGLLKSGKGYYSTPKLIEAYKVTEGFTTITTLTTLGNDTPTAKKEKSIGDYDND
ncbi:MAG: hypothetical protein ABSF44_02370 [Candidatus Bathyarchaeia archaeon]